MTDWSMLPLFWFARVVAPVERNAAAKTLLHAGRRARAQRQAVAAHHVALGGRPADGTARGGVIAAIAHSRAGGRTIPVRFIGVGEGIDDLRPFVAEDFVAALLDS